MHDGAVVVSDEGLPRNPSKCPWYEPSKVTMRLRLRWSLASRAANVVASVPVVTNVTRSTLRS